MGARGRNANVINRAPHKNRRPNANTRAKRAASGDVEPESKGWWDLVCRGSSGVEPFWEDFWDPAREAAWNQHKSSIMARWYSKPYTYGERPSAWWAFEAPALTEKAKLSVKRLKAMSQVEIIHAIAGPEERAGIEQKWLRDLGHAKDGAQAAGRSWRDHALKSYRVPGWFFDRHASEILDSK